jgi:CRP-like cAMP-binding protein
MTSRAAEQQLERELFVRSLLPDMRGRLAMRLAGILEPREVPEGTWLFRAGEPSDQFFLIVEGRVSMEVPGHPPWIFGPRSLVGMLDINLGRPHRRDCRTLEPSRVLVGASKLWLDMFEDDPLFAEGAIRSLSLQLHGLWKQHASSEHDQRSSATPPWPGPLPLYEKVLVLRDAQLFEHAGVQAVASLAQVADELELEAGALLFGVGEVQRTQYVVARGLIELRRGQEFVARCGPLTLVGAAAALSDQLGAYSATALSASLVLRIRAEDYYDQAEEHPELTRAALAYLAIERERMMDVDPPGG